MQKISAIVITLNEESNIKDCLESIKWADEIIVVDSNSKDKTVEIAGMYTNKVFITEKMSFSDKKNLAIEKSSGEWIFWIDADERVTESLKNEIKNIVENPDEGIQAYEINRKSFFINKFIKHCGWYPDYRIRLFRKSAGIKFDAVRVHEKIIYEGRKLRLKYYLLHYTDLTFEHYISKLNSYTSSSALDLVEIGKKASTGDIIFRPVFTFIKMYFLKLGMLDGYTGLVLCTLSCVHVFVKYSKLYFLTQKS
jgi:glycosyltransferase involved in cell wall biosynthesis